MTIDKIEKLKNILSGEVSDTDMVDFVSALNRLIESRKGAIARIDTSTRDGMREYLLARYEEIKDLNTIAHSASSVYAILVLMGQIAKVSCRNVNDPIERMRKYVERFCSAFVTPDALADFYSKVVCLPPRSDMSSTLGITHGMMTGRGLEFMCGGEKVYGITVEQLMGAIRNSITAVLPEGSDEPSNVQNMAIQSVNETALTDCACGFIESNAISAII